MLTTILLASLVASANALTTTTTSPPGPTDPPVMEYWYNQIRTVTKYDLCVGPKGAPKGGPQSWADGTPVILQKCVYNDYKTRIHINGGDGQVFPVGSDLCFDAGESEFLHVMLPLTPPDPGNGSKVKVWKCYPGLKQQQWFLTGDGVSSCYHLQEANCSVSPSPTRDCASTSSTASSRPASSSRSGNALLETYVSAILSVTDRSDQPGFPGFRDD